MVHWSERWPIEIKLAKTLEKLISRQAISRFLHGLTRCREIVGTGQAEDHGRQH